ncbi:MAG: ABC transporter ATP-binding protein [Bacteriovoracaceae bacterium]|nr:ABC transporter ATP-binding protein [Bacteriovoracaceae bacterium]
MNLAINLLGVTKVYPGVTALDNIDLQVRKGSVHGFIGPNGAGKSTTMKIIAGLIPATSGLVEVDGKEVSKNAAFVSTKIGLLPEQPPLYNGMKVGDYLKFCQEINWNPAEAQIDPAELLESILTRCKLQDVKNRLIGNLSKGFKQRVAMAQALVYGADIIILDEPTVGLDPNAIADVRLLIEELKKEHTILLSSHQLHEVAKICDEITIIDQGKILRTGPLLTIQSEFSAFKTYEAILSNLGGELKKELFAKDYIQGMDILEHPDGVFLRIRIQGDQDYRSSLTELLASKGNLLEFKERKMELEEAFREIVRG